MGYKHSWALAFMFFELLASLSDLTMYMEVWGLVGLGKDKSLREDINDRESLSFISFVVSSQTTGFCSVSVHEKRKLVAQLSYPSQCLDSHTVFSRIANHQTSPPAKSANAFRCPISKMIGYHR